MGQTVTIHKKKRKRKKKKNGNSKGTRIRKVTRVNVK